ncbi:hypothetical protein E2C01_081874 [Portunus trituberculatus]|uniref:Uncharacterized protein n=1 Tax=Portunus trituberculatus TaxID=210409 RepID=A0A5B7IX11_PORTR|nr:hypothetical protein [Portunus trituberculatus]
MSPDKLPLLSLALPLCPWDFLLQGRGKLRGILRVRRTVSVRKCLATFRAHPNVFRGHCTRRQRHLRRRAHELYSRVVHTPTLSLPCRAVRVSRAPVTTVEPPLAWPYCERAQDVQTKFSKTAAVRHLDLRAKDSRNTSLSMFVLLPDEPPPCRPAPPAANTAIPDSRQS